jgi:hypothetical protein
MNDQYSNESNVIKNPDVYLNVTMLVTANSTSRIQNIFTFHPTYNKNVTFNLGNVASLNPLLEQVAICTALRDPSASHANEILPRFRTFRPTGGRNEGIDTKP